MVEKKTPLDSQGTYVMCVNFNNDLFKVDSKPQSFRETKYENRELRILTHEI